MAAVNDPSPARPFEIVVSTLPAWPDPSIAIAGSRAGATGVLNLEHVRDLDAARSALARLAGQGRGALGVKIAPGAPATRLLAELPPAITLVVVAASAGGGSDALIAQARASGRRVWAECTTSQAARMARAAGAEALVAKGHEAGGHVAEETTFILLQRLRQEADAPVLAYGGIGLHTAAAACVGGAAGVVLDAPLALAREAAIPPSLSAILERMEGDETVCLGTGVGDLFRVYQRPGMRAVESLRQLEAELEGAADGSLRWRDAIEAAVGWEDPETQLHPLGQDGAFAARLARQCHSVRGIVDAFRSAVAGHVAQARAQRALDRGAALARAHGTEYPILQGPMTRVSDTAAFAEAVAQGGALPFLALALMRGPQVRTLLQETRERLGERPWGVGILGFVPLELRQEQLDVIHEVRPPFAIIAGGRPDQAARLEKSGIATYLHVPAPGLLRMFVEDGARRFIFEGRECGGHVGPRTSFVLWQTMVDALLDAIEAGVPATELQVVFAGGIHDAVSAAMVAALAAPLVERGARIGVLLGTAYLFTAEAVAAGAIVDGFQRAALDCERTVLLESGPGHSTRCVDTPFYETFRQARRRLVAAGTSAEEVRGELETLNLGRLRLASKGILRDDESGTAHYSVVDGERQRQDGMFMIGQLAALRRRVGRVADLHEDVSTGSARRLEGLSIPALPARPPVAAPRPCDVAIVGLGCLLPRARDVASFWANVLGKVDAITEVPRDRFDIDLYYDADRKARDKVYSRWGGFLDDVAFDPTRYGIPPTALPSIDPLQLLSLEVARQALGDAGYLDRDFARERTAVILGLSGGLGDLGLSYGIRSNLPALLGGAAPETLARLPEWTEDSFAGILLNVAAGRVANRFDLGGVNYTVDAACASSLAAVYLAVSELESGTSDMVLVGGVDTVQSPFGFLCFSKAQALSPRGRCRTFDASADGISISEGLAMLVLKRRDDAERDGDRIYAVIKGVAGSSDGRGRSLTAPRPEGQSLALERAYAKAGISPATVGLIEAHGTGTVAGDAAEVAALSDVFRAAGASAASCAIGSVKSMVGHTKSAAGVTGLMKAALALHHKVLPPTLHVTTPNPKLSEAESPFFVNTEALPWLGDGEGAPRRAGVSSFGFGGTNFHAVLEEHAEDGESLDRLTSAVWPAELFAWAGASPAALEETLAAFEGGLEDGSPSLRTLAANLQAASRRSRADADAVRLCLVATDRADLRAKLASAREALREGRTSLLDRRGVYLGAGARAGRLAFLFPGQGSQAPHMLRDLAVQFPYLRASCEAADRALAGRLPRRLSAYVYPPPAFTDAEREAQVQAITDTVVAQPALGAVELGLVALLRSFGVEPELVAGHSYGEYVALAAAGAMSAEALVHISEARGRAIKESVGEVPGTMAAVAAAADEVSQALADVSGVWLANFNAPRQTIVAGAPADVERAIAVLASAGLRAKPIPVACAFHSPLMERARVRLSEEIARLELRPPRRPVFSNTSAAPYPEGRAEIAAQLAEHLVKPVRFQEEVQAMYAAGARLFLEVGPRTVLTGLVRQILDQPDAAAIAIDSSDRHGVVQLLHALGQLMAAGVPVRMERLFAGRAEEERERDSIAQAGRGVAWLVNGSGARPAAKENALAASPPPAPPVTSAAPTPSAPAVPSAAPLPASLPPAASDAVVLQFRDLMSQFLQTQAAVMTAYLQGGVIGAAPTVALTAPATMPTSAIPPTALLAAALPAAPVVPVASVEKAPAPATVAVPPVSAAPAAPHDVGGELLQIVSERTGYPPDMLKLELNLEADLGIDSIKRVEILSALQRRHGADDQARVSAAMERLTSRKTLRELIETLEGALGGPPQSDSGPAAVEDVPRLTLATVEAPLPDARAHRVPARVWLLTDDEGGLASLIADRLLRAGERPVLLQHRGAFVAHGPDRFEADLTRPEHLAEVLGRVREVQGAPSAILHLLPLKAGAAFETLALEEWQDRVRSDIKSLYALTRATADDLTTAGRAGGAMIVAATTLGPSLGGERPPLSPIHGGLGALLKTVAAEMPDVACRALHLDPATIAPQQAAHVLAELAVLEGPVEVGYASGRRVTLAPRLAPLGHAGHGAGNGKGGVPRARTAGVEVAADWVFLVTGGARGITAEIAAYLASMFRPTLVLAGLSAPPEAEGPATAGIADPQELKAALTAALRAADPEVKPAHVEAEWLRMLRAREIRRNLAGLRASGARVEYHAVDVRDASAFGALIDAVYRDHGRLDAVIHGAGIIEDKLVRDKTGESFDRVVQTKTDSAFTLARRLRPEGLKLLLFMSSVTATFGNRGQADYGAANGVLNALAALLASRWPARVRALNWGPWDKTGMVSEQVKAQFAGRGIQVISAPAGVAAVARELESGDGGPVVVFGGGPWVGEATRARPVEVGA